MVIEYTCRLLSIPKIYVSYENSAVLILFLQNSALQLRIKLLLSYLMTFFELTAKYEFKLTPNKGNFENVRQQCASLGGDLITVNLGPEGKQYHE